MMLCHFVKFGLKNNQILKNVFGKSQNLLIIRYLSNFKFSEIVCDKI